tara:strand:- start:6556 stop:7524 length:969 start_codon:yes stop_codon:yes gene_type:complete
VAALVFICLVVPFGVANLLDFSIYFGGEEVRYDIGRDSSNYDSPAWESSGDGPESRCDRNFTDSYGDCAIAQVGPTNWNYIDGEYWKKMPGCYNYTTVAPPSAGPWECGSDGYIISINSTQLFTFGRIAPTWQAQFISGNTYACDEDYFGISLVDYNFEFELWEQTPTSNPLTFTWAEVSSVNLSGTSVFDSAGYDYDTGDTCRATIEATHDLSLSEMKSMENLQNEYFEDIANFTIYLRISLDNLETENGRAWDSTDYYSPFDGGYYDTNYMNVKALTYEVDGVGALLRFGIFLMGLGFYGIAIASTPFWNPIMDRMGGKS